MTEIMMGTLPKQFGGGQVQDITLSITEECNLRCKYCYMVHKNNSNKMTLETAKRIVDYVLSQEPTQNSVVWEFIGGEPTIEMDLVDKISDYIKVKQYILNHPWRDNYMFFLGTNGVLYDSDKVQKYIEKNKGHLSFAITIDGTKEKHDLQRVKIDGSGSYDDVAKNIPLWQKQFPTSKMTKVTFASADLIYLKESIIHLWNLGIPYIAANVVFENVWKEGDTAIFEQQLNELADYIIENELWDKYSVRFFDPKVGFQCSDADNKVNFCGTGRMVAFDYKGDIYPCVRFIDFCMTSENAPQYSCACLGDVDSGVNKNKHAAFKSLSVLAISDEECRNCSVASGCFACAANNYDDAQQRTIFHRAKYNCEMHKAQVRANKRFWKNYSRVT